MECWLYDGRSAVRRGATLLPGDGGIRLVSAAGEEVFVSTGLLDHVESRPGHEVYGHRELPGWRLGVPVPVPSTLQSLLPGRRNYGGLIDRVGLVPALLAGALVSAAIIYAGTRAPDLLAPHVPASWEKRYADALIGDLDGRVCSTPAGQAALDKLTDRLTPRRDIKVRVADLRMVNAVALPGGNIVIFRDLLTEAESPDEAAGVLAHEIAHVENRDVTRAMIRHYGLGMLLVGFGGTTGGNFESLLGASYSRGAETEADTDAIASLQRAGISPAPTARFFDRLGRLEMKLGKLDETFNYISTHPQSAGRRERFLASAEKGRTYRPSLGRDEWEALQDICFVPESQPSP
jgi:Zn-dependent protease with chaperone function